MVKSKEQRTKVRRKSNGSAAERNETKNRNDPKSSPTLNHSLNRAFFLVIIFAILLIIYFVPVLLSNDFSTSELESNSPDLGNIERVRYFLDKFVCDYKPKQTDSKDKMNLDIPGYCHPKLQSSPQNRTQVVSSSRLHQPANIFSLKYTIYWWEKILQQTSQDRIDGGEHMMTLPRPLQIWDLDALRDEFIRQHFLGLSPNDHAEAKTQSPRVALHKESSNPLDSGAYLAVYLLRLLHSTHVDKDDSENQCILESDACLSSDESEAGLISWTDTKQHSEVIQLLRDYLNILPTYGDRTPHLENNNVHEHPIAWDKTMLESLFPKYTHTYNLIVSYQTMVQSEFHALRLSSPNEFGANVNYTQYLSMRINVLSRAFSAMVSVDDIGPSWNAIEKSQTLSDELKTYSTSNFGERSYFSSSEQLSQQFTFRSMCPLLDMYNSHPNPNALWKYDPATSSYLIYAHSDGIPAGHDIIVSYGKYTEGHLFSKYGYVNGDGSSKTEVSLNVFHRMLGDVGLSWQYSPLPFHFWDQNSIGYATTNNHHNSNNSKTLLQVQSKELLRYLLFDDGHEDCIVFDYKSNTLSNYQELKLLKFQHLKHLANIREAWVVRLPAKSPDAMPLQGSSLDNALYKNENKVGIDAKRILSICRLLSLTTDDIGGDAIKYLKDGLSLYALPSTSKKSHFQVEKHDDALEYRSLMCVARLSGIALQRYGINAHAKENSEPIRINSRKWVAWYIRDGEMRILSILRQTAANEANKLKNRVKSLPNPSILFMRERQCPIESSLPILQM